MDQQRAASLRFLGKNAGRDSVHLHRQLGLALGPVYCGVGRRVHDEVRLDLAHEAPDGIGVGQVERGMVGRERGLQNLLELRADLAVAAGQQEVHGKTSASRKRGASASRLESTGLPSNGQRIARSGSSQRMMRSSSGAQYSESL